MKRWCTAIVALLLLSSPSNAQIQVTELATELALSCRGTLTTRDTHNSESIINMGIIVNLAEKTILGFGELIAKIYTIDAGHISFEAHQGPHSIIGDFDRITGYIHATQKNSSTASMWQLYCNSRQNRRPE
jgi:hypothetical protein